MVHLSNNLSVLCTFASDKKLSLFHMPKARFPTTFEDIGTSVQTRRNENMVSEDQFVHVFSQVFISTH